VNWRAVSADIDGDGVNETLSDFNDWQAVREPTRGFGWVGVNAGVEDWMSVTDTR